MKKLVNQVILDFDFLVPGSCSIKDSFSHSPHVISSYPTFDQVKEAISQITLEMDKI